MKIRNKTTGEIATLTLNSDGETLIIMKDDEMIVYGVAFEDLIQDWEDYEEPKDWYYIDISGVVKQGEGNVPTHLIDGMKQIGNYFDIQEEAEQAVEKLKGWKRLKANGVVFDGCFDRFGETHNHRDVVVFLLKAEAPDRGEKLNDKIEDDLDLLFGGEK